MTKADAVLRILAGVALALGLAACSTTVTTASGPVSEASAPSKTESDPARRAQVRMELATAYFGRGQLKFAMDEVKLALDANPRMGAAYNLRGLIQAAQGDYAPAEDSFRKALAIDPRDVDALQNYGWFLCQRKRYAEAQSRFDAALAVPTNANSPRTLLAEGVCQAEAGRLEDAERSLMSSHRFDPGNLTTSFHLASVLLKRGDAERARFYIRRVNSVPGRVSAQSLWLAVRIEHKLGNRTGVRELGAELMEKFRETSEAVSYERGQFDE